MIYGLLLICAVPLVILLINVSTWYRPVDESPSVDVNVSVLIPARNEEQNIATCLQHILSSTHTPYEIIVYNDNSTDKTAKILADFQNEYSFIKVLNGGSLPKGWMGKNHACHHLAHHATGDVLLFIDADTQLQPSGIGHLAHCIQHHSLPSDLVTALPRQLTDSWGEKILMPFLHLTFLAWLPLELVRRSPFPSMTAAIGQVVMIRKTAYLQSGGFEAISNELVDDMAMATRFKQKGLHVRFIDGFNVAHCRMYTSFTSVWKGFSKNIFLGLRKSIPLWVFVIGLYSCCFVLPFALLIVLPWLSPQAIIVVMTCVCVNLTIRILMSIRYAQSIRHIVWHPIASFIVVALFINSGIQTLMGNIKWKGREYSDVHT